MAYIEPCTVDSPRKNWRLTKVLYNAKALGWSVAEGEWDGEPAIGMRWNGSDETDGVGNPQSRGNPTWFIVPQAFQQSVRDVIETLKHDELQVRAFQPEGYDPSVWRLEIILSEQTLKDLSQYMQIAVHFSIPKIKDVNIIPEIEYRAYLPEENGIGGKFSEEGRWLGDVYMHPDKYNDTFFSKAKDGLLENIQNAILRYLGKAE